MFRRLAFIAALCLITASAYAANDRMLVSPNWLAKNLDNVTIIEVGDAITFASGHIPNARLVPFAQLVTDRDGIPNELPEVAKLEDVFTMAGAGDGRRIVLYSRDPLYATRAFFTLDYLGQGSRIAILNGGFAAWQKDAFPLATTANNSNVVMFKAELNPGVLATLNTVKQVVSLKSGAVIIDARPAEQFFGEVAGIDVKRAGHIPGAVNVTVPENFVPGAIPLFKTEADLRTLYTKAGVTNATTNIAYCRTGMQATVTYFALRYLGYNAQLYDGSFVEWSKAADTTVASLTPSEVPQPAGR